MSVMEEKRVPTQLLQVAGLTVEFLDRRNGSRTGRSVRAVDNVDLTIGEGEAVALVGESGCGKSTLGRTIVRLERPTRGRVFFESTELTKLEGRALRSKRRGVQMVFQDSSASLNPRHTVYRVISETLQIAGMKNKSQRNEMVQSLMERVGLSPKLASRRTSELSGGQRQRVGIARALSVQPRLLICDEPTSALDMSVKAQILNVLRDVKQEGLALLFISHDLSSVRQLADRVAVMYLGSIVELGSATEIYENPRHPYTKALLSSIPDPDTFELANDLLIDGEPPSPRNIPSGCRFRTRCPFAEEVCRVEIPELRPLVDSHLAACHLSEQLFA